MWSDVFKQLSAACARCASTAEALRLTHTTQLTSSPATPAAGAASAALRGGWLACRVGSWRGRLRRLAWWRRRMPAATCARPRAGDWRRVQLLAYRNRHVGASGDGRSALIACELALTELFIPAARAESIARPRGRRRTSPRRSGNARAAAAAPLGAIAWCPSSSAAAEDLAARIDGRCHAMTMPSSTSGATARAMSTNASEDVTEQLRD